MLLVGRQAGDAHRLARARRDGGRAIDRRRGARHVGRTGRSQDRLHDDRRPPQQFALRFGGGLCHDDPLMTDTLIPGLYIVATPIGNLGDLSARAARVLSEVALIAAEDTRVTAKLLHHIGVKRPMVAYHDHNADRVRPGLVARLGVEAIALVSDAGTPLISDPGYKLVRDARAAGHTVVTIPGPCAAVAALTLAGLPPERFLFVGFLPAKSGAQAEAIAEIASIRATLVLYESGPRLAATLGALAEALTRLPVSKAAGEVARRFGLDRKALYARAMEMKG